MKQSTASSFSQLFTWRRLLRVGVYALFALALSMIITIMFTDMPSEITEGEVATRDIRVDRDYEIVDEETTNRFRSDAAKTVVPVFDMNTSVLDGLLVRVSVAFSEARSSLKDTDIANVQDFRKISPKSETEDKLQLMRQTFVSSLSLDVTDEIWNELLSNGFSTELEKRTKHALSVIMGRPLIDAQTFAGYEGAPSLVIRTMGVEGRVVSEESWSKDALNNIQHVETVREKMAKKVFSVTSALPLYAADLVASLIVPNVRYNIDETDRRRANTINDVKPVSIKMRAGEVIVRRGSRIEKKHVDAISAIRAIKQNDSLPLKVVGNFIILLLVECISVYFGKRYIRKYRSADRHLLYQGTVLVLMMLALRFFLFVYGLMADSAYFAIVYQSFHYALPIVAAPILIRVMLNAESTLLFSVVYASMCGLFLVEEPLFAIFAFVGCMVAVTLSSRIDKRSSIIRIGFYCGLAEAVMVIGILLVQADSVFSDVSLSSVIAHVFLTMTGGVLSAILVMVFMPIIEPLFGYTSDIKLLEMANLNHPLLRELIIRAPGTYHHSHLVGVLAEAAADSIGANALLAKVAAYYHDIGKIKKPHYFIENDPNASLRHEKLSPHMSALIISSHVKEGLELAREYKLPQAVTDMIPQHHGTKLISFFYDRAKEQSDSSIQRIDERDFRYAGPKPQTREAGVLLLADTTEATVRSLKEKTPARIRQTVYQIVHDSFEESQLDECDLTLRNLTDVAEAFIRILTSIYHHRIDYAAKTAEFENNGEEPVRG